MPPTTGPGFPPAVLEPKANTQPNNPQGGGYPAGGYDPGTYNPQAAGTGGQGVPNGQPAPAASTTSTAATAPVPTAPARSTGLTYPDENAVLNAVGRPPDQGWRVVGRTMATQTVPAGKDDYGNPTAPQLVPTGNYQWVIAGPNGQTDTIVVAPQGGEPISGGQGPSQVSYAIVAPPARQLGQPNPPPREGDTRPNVNSQGYQIQEIYQGGSWVPDTRPDAPKPIPWTPEAQAAPYQGKTITTVEGGNVVTKIYDGGVWKTDPTKPPIPWSDQAKRDAALPQENNTRPNVTPDGYAVQEIYKGGSWVIDQSVAPKAFTPGAIEAQRKAGQQPNKGDTQPAIEGGWNVTQTWDGTRWVTTAIGSPATPEQVQADAAARNAPKEGDKRMAPSGDYVVPQIFSKGQWIPDLSPDAPKPTRYMPMTPSTITTSADQPVIVRTDANGNPVYLQNPNYAPTDPAARVAYLQNQANQVRDTLEQQVKSQAISPDQANSQFQNWWQANVAPQQAEIQQQQRDIQQKSQIAAMGANTAAQNAATSFGQNLADIAMKQNQNRVGPGFQAAFNAQLNAIQQGKAPPPIDYANAVTYKTPNYVDQYQQAVAQALKTISPTAAGLAGAGQPQMPDLTAGLQIGNYMPGTSTGGMPGATVTQGGGNYHPQPAPMPAVPPLGAQTGPNLNPSQPAPTQWAPTLPSGPAGLSNPGGGSGAPGSNQGLVFSGGRMVPPGQAIPPAAAPAAPAAAGAPASATAGLFNGAQAMPYQGGGMPGWGSIMPYLPGPSGGGPTAEQMGLPSTGTPPGVMPALAGAPTADMSGYGIGSMFNPYAQAWNAAYPYTPSATS